MTPSRRASLHRDEALGVLWLTRRRQELALSADGIWLRAGGQRRELRWSDVAQVQLADPRGGRACVEIFAVAGTYSVGPFPAAMAERWVRASVDVARRRGLAVREVVDGAGFALPPPADGG